MAQGKTIELMHGGEVRRPHNGMPQYRVNGVGGQVRIIQTCLANFITVCAFGRAFGKTATAFFLFWEEFRQFPGHVYEFAYCAPTRINHAVKVYRQWKELLKPITTWHSDVELTLHVEANGKKAILDFWGLDEHDNKRGARKHRIIVDECKDVAELAFFATLLPMLLGRDGKALLQGTPGRWGIGNGWFKRAFDLGVKREAGYVALTAPSMDNPYLTQKELDALIAACPDEKTLREEIYAEWLSDEGAVFSNLAKTFSLKTFTAYRWGGGSFIEDADRSNLWVHKEADEGDKFRKPDLYVAGLDFGIKDATVWTLFNRRTMEQEAVARFQGHEDYTTIIPAIDALMDRWNAPFVVFDEGGGHGGAIREYMARHYQQGIRGRRWGFKDKIADITRAQFLCSKAGTDEGWALIDVPWQKLEFERFQVVTQNKAGEKIARPRFGAPPGMNDDAVTSACLAATCLSGRYQAQMKKQQPTFGTHDYFDRMVAFIGGKRRSKMSKYR